MVSLNNYAKYDNMFQHDIFIAIEKNSMESIINLINNKGIDINIRNRYQETPLMIACRWNRIEIAKYLIDHGANSNLHDQWNDTALSEATFSGHYTIAKYLIDHGDVNVNDRANNNKTPLMIAAIENRCEIAKYLIENNVQINDMNEYNEPALLLAARHGHVEMFKLLLFSSHLSISNCQRLYNFSISRINQQIILSLMKERDRERYFTFCALFSVGTYPVDDDMKEKQEQNSLMIGYDPPLEANDEVVRPFPPMFDSNLDESLFDATLAGEIWKFASDLL